MVPLTDKAAALLKRYMKESRLGRVRHPDDPCLFPGRNGTRISRVGVWKLIKKHAATAGIAKNFNPRALRHAFAMHLILGGMDLDGIKFLFGYRQLEAAALYEHVNAPDFRQAYQTYHPSAVASRRIVGLSPTSTIDARPCSSRCVSSSDISRITETIQGEHTPP